MMENSQSSCASTIPCELLSHCDPEFLDELEAVNELYFGNIEISDSDVETEVNDNDSDSENDICSEIENSCNNVSNDLDIDPEAVRQRDFKQNGCGCVRLYGKPCSSVVDWNGLISYRLSCMEKSKDELDMIIKFQLFHHRSSSSVTVGNKRKPKDREKSRQHYYFGGMHVCREVFAFAHAISRKAVDALSRSLDESGLEPRVHGNTHKKPHNSLTLADVETVKVFLQNYGVHHGVPLPGKMPNYKNEKYVLLPSDKNKTDIYTLYCQAADLNNQRKVGSSTFRKIWLEQCPYLLVMKPASDLCLKCQKHVAVISKSGNLTEEEKTEKLANYQEHIFKVKTQRDYYRDQCETTKVAFDTLPPEKKVRGVSSGTSDATVHYSFDYAQQVFYPHYSQQVGPLYFKTPRKCQCFGVCCESSGSQIFYLIDEEFHSVGKGANSVTSMLHHHFEYLAYGEKHAVMHMDNCAGQNKNNTVIGYGLWRTMTGLHESVEFSLMEAGHTKFSPDWHFGLWKVRWRNSTVETLEDIAQSVHDSSRSGHNMPHLVGDVHRPVVFYDWASFLKEIFKPLPKILSYHHFRMTASKPGVVYVRQYATDPEVEVSLLRKTVDLTGMVPNRLPLPGLDARRMWYLYEEIAPLCHSSSSACPKPSIPKPVRKSSPKQTYTKCEKL